MDPPDESDRDIVFPAERDRVVDLGIGQWCDLRVDYATDANREERRSENKPRHRPVVLVDNRVNW